MGSIYKRGNIYWVAYVDRRGRQHCESSRLLQDATHAALRHRQYTLHSLDSPAALRRAYKFGSAASFKIAMSSA